MSRLPLLFGALALLALSPTPIARALPPPTANAAPGPAAPSASETAARALAARLHPQTGDIALPAANAVLHLGQDYYFLPADEARLVLTEGWGNPPDAATGVLGIVFPAGRNFHDADAWGAVISYEATGYVSDADAESADYAALLQEMRAGEAEENRRRAAGGFPTQQLVGWAEPPTYDRRTHSLVWARNIQVSGLSENALNYDVRLLGRSGVLSLNMVTGMTQLAQTREAARRFAAQVEFTPGNRYADYRPGDRTADHGVAGLVAAGVGVAAAQKAGLLALLLAFLKQAGIFILAGLVLLWGWLRGAFSRHEERAAAPPPAAAASAGKAPPARPGG